MPDKEISNSAPGFEYISACLQAIAERRYREALTTLDEGVTKQLASPQTVDAADLLKHFRALIAYLDSQLGEDFGTGWETQPYEEDQTEVRCSFCGKKEPEVKQIIAGPGVFICNECIRTCEDALTK